MARNSSDLNQVTLLGRLTRDPELRTVGGNRSVCTFDVAVNRSWKDNDGNVQSKATFIHCIQWGKAAEATAKFGASGRKVLITGYMTDRSYESKAFVDGRQLNAFVQGLTGKTVSVDKVREAFRGVAHATIPHTEVVVERLLWQDAPKREAAAPEADEDIPMDDIDSPF